MSEGFKFTVLVSKRSKNRLNEEQIRLQLKHVADAASRNKSRGFVGKVQKSPIEPIELVGETDNYEYNAKIQVKNEKCKSEDVVNKNFQAVLEVMKTAAASKGWKVIGEESQVTGAKVTSQERNPLVLPELTPEIKSEYFKDIYDRDAHIRLIHASSHTHVASKGANRTHVLLYGEAASAKTMLFHSFKRLYEQDGVERVLIIDATTSSKAGFETIILQKAMDGLLPEFIYIEEIEKQMKRVPSVFNVLLSIMDSRGSISRTNARIGSVIREAKATIWATSNDEEFIRTYDSGAIWSRFQRRLYCPLPSKELMYKIVTDKVIAFPGGKIEWVEPAIQLGWDVLESRDARFISALAIDGGDALLDGSFQRDILSTTNDKSS